MLPLSGEMRTGLVAEYIAAGLLADKWRDTSGAGLDLPYVPTATGGTAVLDTIRAAAAAGAIVSVDPNIRPALVGDHAGALARFGEAVASADLVKLSDEDARWLYPDLDDEDQADDERRHLLAGPSACAGPSPDPPV